LVAEPAKLACACPGLPPSGAFLVCWVRLAVASGDQRVPAGVRSDDRE
jgi:hypothetical protein